MWSGFVELIRMVIFGAAHVCGGSLGAGIVAISAIVRLALLPLTLRLAREGQEQQRRIAALKPRLDHLKQRHGKDRVRLMQETQALYAANGIRALSRSGFVGMLVQMPLVSGLLAAVRGGLGARVRFLWITDLARPDALLVGAVTLLAGAIAAMPRPQGVATGPSPVVQTMVAAGLMLALLWSASSAVALSFGAGSLVSGLQNWLLARERRQQTASV